MGLTAGTKLDGYEVLGLLGAGGMGEVYRARDSVLKREVAIKVLPSFVSQDPDRLRRFEQEAQAAGVGARVGFGPQRQLLSRRLQQA